MRSAITCVFLALIIHKGRAAGDDFRPTPIPLNEWQNVEDRHARAGTLQETIKTESPLTVAAIPAHYWEDALRHSVYLTLVRDKIDQLIAKGDVVSPGTKPDKKESKEIDDHDLWEKIKTAPFDRIEEEDPSTFGDIAIMATGRLLEEKDGFRFTEDERSKEKCIEDKCMDGVKAIWSVKRIRQRDQEMSPGRYHYELTFSVISQTPKKQKKPFENPIRTFTVRESTPDRTTIAPQKVENRENTHSQVMRPERAVWIHKNIVPTKYHLGRSYYHGLDRIFSSLFSYDDDDETPPESTARHKSNSYVPQFYPSHSKAGYVGASTDQHQQNQKYTPYPYKQPLKSSRPIVPPPLASAPHHYLDIDSAEITSSNQYNNGYQYTNNNQYNGNQHTNGNQYNGNQHTNGNQYNGNHHANVNQYNGNQHNNGIQYNGNVYTNGNHYNGNQFSNNDQYNNGNQYTNGNHYNNGNQYVNGNHYNNGNPHTLQSGHKISSSSKPIRTTRPAVLPTPLPPIPPTKDLSFEVGNMMRFGNNDTTHLPETITIYKNYNKFRAPPGKVNYFPENVRPPIYNAPPGVFVTMDKKPFKPMPPLKHMPTSKPLRHNRPIDFRPSPQIPDGQSAEPDAFVETAFRPITAGYADRNSTEDTDVSETFKKAENKLRKTNGTRKPSKKHDNVKSQKLSTNAPDIITAANVSEEDVETMEWANILGAFTKTTPMASAIEKLNVTESTTPLSTTETISTAKRRTTTTTEAILETTTSTTTPKPKKRTRPPPKFVKQDKLKKHKRITSTTTTSTTKAPEKSTIKRPTKDLTPQASSAAVSSTKSLLETTSKKIPASTKTTTTTTTSTSTTPVTTSTATTTTTTTTPRSTTKTSTTTKRPTTAINESSPKDKNRFRQSTLMLKGTSVKHDKWSFKNQTNTTPTGKYPYRRKGSNFQGYIPAPMPRAGEKETRKRHHEDRASGFSTIGSITEETKSELTTQPTTTESIKEETDSINETTAGNQEEEYDETEEEKNVENTEEESKDNAEFIFQATTSQPNVINNEVIGLDEDVTSDHVVETTPHSAPKNKTKCKKKKTSKSDEEKLEHSNKASVTSTTTTTTTTSTEPTTSDIFQDLFDFNFGSTSEKTNEISSHKPELDEEESENHEKYLKIDDDFKDFLDNLGEKQTSSETNTDEDEQYDDDDDKESPPIDDEDSEITSGDEKNSGRHSSDDNYEDYQDRPYSFLELLAME